MNELRQIEHLADMARERQAEMLRFTRPSDLPRSGLNRWRAGLFVLICLGLPVAFFLVRAW